MWSLVLRDPTIGCFMDPALSLPSTAQTMNIKINVRLWLYVLYKKRLYVNQTEECVLMIIFIHTNSRLTW